MGTIPMNRVMERFDRLNAVNDAAGARRHLLYWLEEARLAGDERAQLSICNELMGAFRLAGNAEEAVRYAESALVLIDKLELEGTVSAGTVHVNCGTVFTAFGRPADAIPHYEHAAEIYRRSFHSADARLGSLYNNMAACLAATGEYAKAEEAYGNALRVMGELPGSEPECAVTQLNLADLLGRAYGPADACERIDDCTQKAHDLLEKPGVARDTNYAQVCGKCAPIFEYYGWFAYARELRGREKEIYENARKDG